MTAMATLMRRSAVVSHGTMSSIEGEEQHDEHRGGPIRGAATDTGASQHEGQPPAPVPALDEAIGERWRSGGGDVNAPVGGCHR